MRKWFKTSVLIFCLVLQSCSTITVVDWEATNERTPASDEGPFTEIAKSMNGFKARLMGSEKDSTCTKEQLDADFNKILASLKRNNCSVANYTVDRQEFEQRSCPKVKVEGYFDKMVKVTIKEEKLNKKDKKKTLTFFQNRVDEEFLKFYKQAQNYFEVVSTHIVNNKYSEDDRLLLIALYVDSVLLPMRDVVTVMRAYLPKEEDGRNYYESLVLTLDTDFVERLDVNGKGLLTMGPNPQAAPFYLDLKDQRNGKTKLAFSETEIMKRDVLTLLKAPTAKNYVLALKWMTLHMMLSQAYLYEILVGGEGKINIPKSCQNTLNTNLPSSIKFNYENGKGEEFIESIIANHGLASKEDDSTYYEYYMDNINRDPTKAGYSGLIPFENYKNALRSSEKSGALALEPQFDDIAHFQNILSFKLGEAQRVFKSKVKGQNVNLVGEDIFQKMLGQYAADDVQDIQISKTETKQIYAGKQNLSPYLLSVMQANGFTDYSQLITERMKKKFVGRRVKIEFPSMYSSPAWRDWSLRTLADVVYLHKDDPANTTALKIATKACLMTTRKTGEMEKICKPGGNPLAELSDFLAEFRTGEKYIPSKRLEEGRFQDVYPFMGYLWQNFRDYKIISQDEVEPYELNFLLSQMSAGNPWARLKFSYMVALDQIEHQQDGIKPKYETRNEITKENEELICKQENLGVLYNNLERAGKVLGLDKPLSYNHAGSFLTAKEKIEVWRGIVDDIHQGNAQLFSVKERNESYYQRAENISYKTILTEEEALKAGGPLTQKATKEVKEVGSTTTAEITKFFLELYKLRDPVKQKKLFEEFSKVNGIDNTYSVKLAFLNQDEAYKRPLYKDILKQAAETRRLQVISQLHRFCQMDANNEVEFKNIFYATTKAQNDINKSAGLPSVPDDVLDKVNSMTASEWRDMWWGIGSGLAGMAAFVVASACTMGTGGVCSPVAAVLAGVGASALGTSSMAIQVVLTKNELNRHDEAAVSAKEIKLMEELGFANSGSSEEVSRSYAWVAMEAISIFPLIGIATRSATLGPKLVYLSGREMMRRNGKFSFKTIAKAAIQEEEVRAAQYLLGATSVSKNLGVDAKALSAATKRIDKIRALYISGEITLEESVIKVAKVLDPIKRARLAIAKTARGEIGKVTVKQTVGQVDELASGMIANYFADNPKEMLRFVQGYSGERLNQAVKIMDQVNAVDEIGGTPVFTSMKNWYLKMRHESLANNASKILKLEKDLAAMGDNTSGLEAYLKKNMDDVTSIFRDIPLRKRELPYFVFIQGSPDFNFFKGRKIPFLSSMSQGQTIKRIVTARARLVQESLLSQARLEHKLPRYVQSETIYDAFKDFQKAIAHAATEAGGKEGAKYVAEYKKVEDAIAKKLFKKFTEKNKLEYKSFMEMIAAQSKSAKKAEFETFKKMIFSPQTARDQAYAQSVWSSIPPKELLGIGELGKYADEVIKSLANYKTVDGFERLLAAFKMRVMTENSAVLEIM